MSHGPVSLFSLLLLVFYSVSVIAVLGRVTCKSNKEINTVGPKGAPRMQLKEMTG